MLTDTQIGFDKCKKNKQHVSIVHTRDVPTIFFGSQLLNGGKAWQNVKGGRGGGRGPSKTEHFGVGQPPAMCLVHSHNALGLFLNVFIC